MPKKKYKVVVTPGTVIQLDRFPSSGRAWIFTNAPGRIVSICGILLNQIPVKTSGDFGVLGRENDAIAVRLNLTLDDFEIINA